MAKLHTSLPQPFQKAQGTFLSQSFQFFSNRKRTVKSTFLMLLLKTLLHFPRILQLSSEFWLQLIWLTKTHSLPNVNLSAFHSQKSQLVIIDFVIFQRMKYHYKMDIQTWCVATSFKEGGNIFCTVRLTAAPHFQISGNKHLVCPQHELK